MKETYYEEILKLLKTMDIDLLDLIYRLIVSIRERA